MMSRNAILAAVAKNQPEASPLPDISMFEEAGYDFAVRQYEAVLTAIGGTCYQVGTLEEIKSIIQGDYKIAEKRVLSLAPGLEDLSTHDYVTQSDAHTLEDVELAIIEAHLAVAENGAVWVTDHVLPHRAIPFICQHLAVLIRESNIVDTMHQAYKCIGNAQYGFGTFIAGPSKTADIEQSLVLGAHGPRSITVFLMR